MKFGILSFVLRRFAASCLDKSHGNETYEDIIEKLIADDKLRLDFMKSCLLKLGLRVNTESVSVPSLSKLHLTSVKPSNVKTLVDGLQDIVTCHGESQVELIVGENDLFVLEK